jgi:hypothetical protein
MTTSTQTHEPSQHSLSDDVHDMAAELPNDIPVAKIDDRDELLLQQPDEPEIADLVKETPDDAHHNQVVDEDCGTPIDKVQVGIGATDDSQLPKQYERRHSMVIDGYRQALTYINEAFETHHWCVQGRIGIG